MSCIFLHIPKAGGTTIHSVLDRMYAPETVHDIVIRNGKLTIDEFIAVTDKQKLNVLKGHMVFGLHAHFPKPNEVKYFTFLRNPVSRAISQYTYILTRPDHYLYAKVKGNNMSLVDFTLSDLSIELDNGQVRLISGQNDLPIGQIGQAQLELAKQNIEKHFIAVGLVEQFNESLILLKERLQWPTYPYYRQLNVSKEKHQLESDARARIAERNKYDVELYTWAKQRFETAFSNIPDASHKMHTMHETMKAFHDGHEQGFALAQKSFQSRKSRLDTLRSIFGKK